MKIGFFGDSFSAEKSDGIMPKYNTYIELLEKEYKTKVKIYSKGGTSHWDAIINQFLPNIDNLPDVCIFTWPDENRFFHRTVRNIRLTPALDYSNKKYKRLSASYNFGFYKKEWQAAEMYYNHLFDEEKNDLEYKSSLHYFDHVILDNIKNKKFIHLWSFKKKHNWSNSIELETPLLKIAEQHISNYHDPKLFDKHLLAPNHLPTQELNEDVFDRVKGLIDETFR